MYISFTLEKCTLIATEGPGLLKTYLQFTQKNDKLSKVEEREELTKLLLDLFLVLNR